MDSARRTTISQPRITGRAWIGNGAHQVEWEFALLLPRSVRTREAIDWAALIPPDDFTGWLSFDEAGHWLELDPGAAMPDFG